MLTKKNLWFLTLFSIILVMAVYYISVPTGEITSLVNAETSNAEDLSVTVKESEAITALRVGRDEELEKEILADKKEEPSAGNGGGSSSYDPSAPDLDELLPAALKLCIETGGASINMVQRRFRVGYARAARIIDQMELAGYISVGNGSKLRTVHMTMSEFKEKFGDDV